LAQHGRRADADAAGKAGGALQAGNRIFREQLVGDPALGGRKVLDAIPQPFHDRAGHRALPLTS